MRAVLLLPERREGKTKMMKQQHLPFTVLKQLHACNYYCFIYWLQQYLPFTVLKPLRKSSQSWLLIPFVATVLTVYGIET